MKKLGVLLILILGLFSCKKDKSTTSATNVTNPSPTPTPTVDPYAKPWNTKFISIKNGSNSCGSHYGSYEVFYKDLKLWQKCEPYDYCMIIKSIVLNDSILFLVEQVKYGFTVQHSTDGGFNWQNYPAGGYKFIKFLIVNTELSYIVLSSDPNNPNIYSLTGIGKSNLSLYQDTLKKGTHTIFDTGTSVTHLDSTLININDSVNFVIKFK